jgi:hypothetical protein
MTHRGRDAFVDRTEGESATGLGAIAFTIGSDGIASSVWMENLDIHGHRTFPRRRA